MSNLNEIVKMPRGEVRVMTADIAALTEGLSDYGVVCTKVELDKVAQMLDADFVDLLTDIRLRDQLLLLSARLDDPALIRARYNVDHCFSKLGGRAVFVAA